MVPVADTMPVLARIGLAVPWLSGLLGGFPETADQAEARECERESPHVQSERPVSTHALTGEQRRATADRERADHVARRGRRRRLDRARTLEASEGENEGHERDRVRGNPWDA